MARIRQGRLFAPVGMYKGNPDKLSPEQFVAGNVPGHTVAWHATDAKALPAYDRPHENPALRVSNPSDDDADWDGYDTDESEDEEGRPMADYGSAVGLHFGTLKAADERAQQVRGRQFIHPVAIPDHTLVKGQFTDRVANYNPAMTDLVENGRTVAYKNEMEDRDSVSYRTAPQTVKTWGEHVLEAHEQHSSFADRWGREPGNMGLPRPTTAQVYAAQQGYNPVVSRGANALASFREDAHRGVQQSLFTQERWAADLNHESGGRIVYHATPGENADDALQKLASSGSKGDMWQKAETPGSAGMWNDAPDHLSKMQFVKTGLRE